MDRLTLTGAEGVKAFCSLCADKPSFGKCEIAKECYSRQVYLALRAYEDTGLTPGNITYQTASLQEWQRKCALMPIDNAQLRAELEQVKKERDAAVEDMRGYCRACVHKNNTPISEPCKDCNRVIKQNWQWRGLEGEA